MAQKNFLLFYRKQLYQSDKSTILGSKYNFVSGLWEKENSSIIDNFWNSYPVFGTTLITKTREGIDRSEGSN